MKMSELENKLKGHSQRAKSTIATPFDLKTEIKKMEEKNMSKTNNKRWLKRTIAIAATLSVCLVVVMASPLANSIKGFFKDIVRFDGAITGTQYVNATNELKLNVLDSENNDALLPLEITFENKNEAPFAYIQEMAITEYKIVDSNNKEIDKSTLKIENALKGTISDGKVLINIPLDSNNLKSGETYTLKIDSLYGLSKADAPLEIKGSWSCSFTR
ncbi:MAG: hypothetical protein IKU66_04390 [Clostridia bacterium]|nr:hypothetical protein [Clostridia bacterium]